MQVVLNLLERNLALDTLCDGLMVKLLTVAVSGGAYGAAEVLLQRGANVAKTAKPDAKTPLVLAVARGSKLLVNLLLNNGTDINSALSHGQRTALHMAVVPYEEGGLHDTDMIQLLIDRGADLDPVDRSGFSPVCYAVKSNQPAILRQLLDHGASPDPSPPTAWPLNLACMPTRPKLVRLLLQHGVGVRKGGHGSLTELGNPFQLALYQCTTGVVLKGDSFRPRLENTSPTDEQFESAWRCVSLLCKAGYDINGDSDGWSLEHAFYEDSLRCVRRLLESGADPNLHGDPPQISNLGLSLRKNNIEGRLEMLRLCAEYGMDFNETYNEEGITVLMEMCRDLSRNRRFLYQGVKFLKTLLEHGADPTLLDTEGRSALSYFCHPEADQDEDEHERDMERRRAGRPLDNTGLIDAFVKVFEILLEFGADPNSADVWHAPLRMRHIERPMVAVLLHHGLDINQQDIYRLTALHWAAMKNDGIAIDALLEAGISIHLRDEDHRTAGYYMEDAICRSTHTRWLRLRHLVYDHKRDRYHKVRV